jgi:hypothetical protein
VGVADQRVPLLLGYGLVPPTAIRELRAAVTPIRIGSGVACRRPSLVRIAGKLGYLCPYGLVLKPIPRPGPRACQGA